MSTYNRVVAAEETTSSLPVAVRARLATEMADPTSDVGASLFGTFSRPLEVVASTGVGPILVPTSATTLVTSRDVYVRRGVSSVAVAAGASVALPGVLVAGTDYVVDVLADGALAARDWDTAAPAGSAVLGGIHFAPGGNAPTLNTGGDTTPAFNLYSAWDPQWRPLASPRGMTRVLGIPVWVDIYLAHRDYGIDGFSRGGATIARGTSSSTTSIIPTILGGDGIARFSTFNAYDVAELLGAFGKRLPRIHEFAMAARGVVEKVSLGGVDDFNTGLDAGSAGTAAERFTSQCGVIQASGCVWIPAAEWGGPYGAAAWADAPAARGRWYNAPNVPVVGGYRGDGSNSGSRASGWFNSAASSGSDRSGRGVCDHLGPVG